MLKLKEQIMLDKIGLILKKYAVPGIFLTVGLIVLIVGMTSGQSTVFMFSAGMMLVAGILSVLYSMGKLKPGIVYGSGIAVGVIALILIYMSFSSVAVSQKYEKDRDNCKELAKQNLMDIRYVQKIHKEQNGTYLGTWEELVDFTKNGTMPYVVSEGTVPGVKITPEERDYLYNDNRPIDNNMTEDEAYRLSKWTEGPRYNELFIGFKRDTIQVSIMKTKFENKSYVSNREKLGFYRFSADSLPYIPYTGSKLEWDLQVEDSIMFDGVAGPAIQVLGEIPFAEVEGASRNIVMGFGKITSHDVSGSWEDE
jgi:hypothetical protein